MFIKLTDAAETALRVNIKQIVTYALDPSNSLTVLLVSGGVSFHVKHTPEEIDRKIEKVTNQTIGGEY